MPNQANLVVKAEDGTTNVTFTAIQPSAGTKLQPALWRRTDYGATPQSHPYYTHYADQNQTGTVRRAFGTFVFPVSQVVENTGNATANILSKVKVDVSVSVPQNIASAITLEAVTQALNCALATKLGFQQGSNYV